MIADCFEDLVWGARLHEKILVELIYDPLVKFFGTPCFRTKCNSHKTSNLPGSHPVVIACSTTRASESPWASRRASSDSTTYIFTKLRAPAPGRFGVQHAQLQGARAQLASGDFDTWEVWEEGRWMAKAGLSLHPVLGRPSGLRV